MWQGIEFDPLPPDAFGAPIDIASVFFIAFDALGRGVFYHLTQKISLYNVLDIYICIIASALIRLALLIV